MSLLESQEQIIHVAVLGRSGIGKTCLALRISKNRFPSYIPRMEFQCAANVQVDGQNQKFEFFEPDVRGDLNRFRIEIFPKIDIALLCFAINDRRSFNELRSVWMNELIQWCPKAPVLLVATKAEVKVSNTETDQSNSYVSAAEASSLARDLYFDGFCECSAISGSEIENLSYQMKYIAHNDGRRKYKPVLAYFEGSKGVGKTSLLSTLAQLGTDAENVKSIAFLPKQIDECCLWKRKNGKLARVALFDTLNCDWKQRTFDRDKANVILLCYSVDCRSSFENIQETWMPKIGLEHPNVLLFLVATKIDSRENSIMLDFLKRNKTSIVTKKEGMALARRIGAKKYLECSCTTGSGVEHLMNKIVNHTIKHMKRKRALQKVSLNI